MGDTARHGFNLVKSQRQLRRRRQRLWVSFYTHKRCLQRQRVFLKPGQGTHPGLRTRLGVCCHWWRASHAWTTFYRWIWPCVSITRCEPVWELQSVIVPFLVSSQLSRLSLASPVDHNPESFLHDYAGVTFVGRPFPLDEAHEHLARLRRWGLTFSKLLQLLHLANYMILIPK